MQRILRALFVVALLSPQLALAGLAVPSATASAPALGQPGLMLLGAALAGTGVALLRSRRK